MQSQVLETRRLRLTPLCAGDADALHRLWTAPGVRRFLWGGRVIPAERTRELIAHSESLHAQSGAGLWGAHLRGEEALMGFAGYWHFHDPAELELIYGVAEEHWGRKLGSELARGMVRYGFEGLGFTEIRATTDAPNIASIRVLERLGFWRERRQTAPGSKTPASQTVFYRLTRMAAAI